jgi:tetratricopeptide (TPR) repeat protein
MVVLTRSVVLAYRRAVPTAGVLIVAIKIKKKKTDEVEEIDPILEADQFLQTSDKSISWAAQNRQKVVVAVVVVASIVIAAVFLSKYTEKIELERTAALSDAVDSLETPITADGTAELGDAPVGPRFPTSEAKYKEVESKADAVLTAYPDKDVANPARLMKARASLGLGKYDEAVTLYQQWLDDNPNASERPIVLQAIATAQAAAGKPEEAVKSLESLVQTDKKLYGEMAAYQIGAIYESAGNKEKAKQHYDVFIKDYPDSGKLELVKLRREAL